MTLLFSVTSLVLTFLLATVSSTKCPDGTGPVFFVDRLSDKNNRCFEKCGTSGCTGVMVSAHTCLALRATDYFGPMRERDFVRKHCVQDVTSSLVVSLHSDRVLLDNTEKIEKAMDKYHCLSLCYNEKKFPCLSAMFYPESGDCLINSANSDTAEISHDLEGFQVDFMERRLKTSAPIPCAGSYQLLPWNSTDIAGDSIPHETDNLQKCLSLCRNCDYVLFNEALKQCFTVISSQSKRNLKFIDHNCQVISNLCGEAAVGCDSYMYVANRGFTRKQKQSCLQKCITDDSCQYGYSTPDGCTVSGRKQTKRSTVERKCAGTERMGMDILFEETEKCPTATGMRIEGMALEQCMTLCLTHPTKSCEAISYYGQSRLCQLLDNSVTSTSKVTSLPKKSGCRHFTLNIITVSRGAQNDHRAEGKSSHEKRKPHKKPRAHAAHNKLDIHRIESKKTRKEPASNITVETICNYHQVVVKVTSSTPLHGKLFPRNGHDNCSVLMHGKTEASLIFDLNKGNCKIEKDGSTYHSVVVVKENNMHGLPIITEDDRMYSISCDYSNQTTKVAATRVIRLRNGNFKNLDLPGNIPFSSAMTMELRQKRQHESKSVTLGQDMDLVFRRDQNLTSDYIVSTCVASSMDNGENVTLLEDGCPTRSAREYIVRGGVRRTDNGFLLPMRAFKFQQNDGVKIACTLRFCDDCEQPKCDAISRRRRMLPEGAGPVARPDVEVEVAMLVREHAEERNNDTFCASATLIYGLSAVGTGLVLIQLLALFYIISKPTKK